MNISKYSESWVYLLVFVFGLIIHLVYIGLLGFPYLTGSLHWSYADTHTYIEPAMSFLRTGMFTAGGAPDSFRTIGYPFFLSNAFRIAETTGMDWRMVVYLAQAVIFAVAYLAIYYLGRDVFGLSRRWAAGCVLFVLVSGIYVAYVPAILSDGLFAAMLIMGVACGFNSLQRKSLLWSVLHVLLITYAANVRPQLALYPVAALCMHWVYLKRDGQQNNRIKLYLILTMFLLAGVGVQTPAFRNLLNYGVFTPSEVASINLYDYLAKDVLQMKKQINRYEQVRRELTLHDDPGMLDERIAIRKREALRVYCDYPMETAAFMIFYEMLNSFETHWNNTLFYMFRQTWYRDYADGSVRWGPLPFAVAVLFVVIYGYVYSVALILAATIRRNYLLMVSILIFIGPFAFCSTSYQGARFRLWFEPLIVLAAAVSFRRLHRIWLLYSFKDSRIETRVNSADIFNNHDGYT
jgi:hypothetical protein